MSIATAETVAQAANTLKNKGENVTQDAVRDLLGGGSLTTISRHLRAWREAETGVPAEPEAVIRAFELARAGVWAAAYKAAAEASASDAAELVQAQADVERLEAELAQVQKSYDDVNGKLSDCFAKLEETRRDRDQLSAANAAQAAEIEVLRQRLIESEKATARAEGALEAFKSMQK